MGIQAYIDLGWYTNPLGGKEIIRVTPENQAEYPDKKVGDKTGFYFTKNWLEKYSSEFNLLDAPIGQVLTEPSRIVGIDLDDQKTYEMFLALDPTNPWNWVSKDKPLGGGTLIYQVSETLPPSFKDNATDLLHIEFYNDKGALFLPTDGNFSKHPFQIPDSYPKKMPPAMEALLHVLYEKSKAQSGGATTSSADYNNYMRLEPLVREALKKGSYYPNLFRVITPKKFRNEAYKKQGHLHPNDISDGGGSDYLYAIATILATDISISPGLFDDIMRYINGLWDSPMDNKRLDQTIINPMITGQAGHEGQQFWQYDPDWQEASLVMTAKNGDNWEVVFDDEKIEYYFINHTLQSFRATEISRAAAFGSSLFGSRFKKKVMEDRTQIIRTDFDPRTTWGYSEGRDRFNLFQQPEPLAIINNPDLHAAHYKKPTNFIGFMEGFIPNEKDREYILRFLRTKLTTFKYSPVVPYFVGVQGSGKNTLLDIIGQFIGQNTIVEVSKGEMMGDFNGYLQNKFFVQINELSKMVKADHKAKDYIYGKLKLWTGNHQILIRAMRTNHFNVENLITFILTDNESPLNVELGDRRIYLVSTPTAMVNADWTREYNDIENARRALFDEVNDIAYFLATEVHNLKSTEYTTAPMTAEKEEMIIRALPYSTRLSTYLEQLNFNALLETGVHIDNLYDIPKGRIWESGLVECYKLMGGQNEEPDKLISQTIKDQLGWKKEHTTKQGQNVFFYTIEELKNFQPMSEIL